MPVLPRPLVAAALAVGGLLAVPACGADAGPAAATLAVEDVPTPTPTPTAANGVDRLTPAHALAAVRGALKEAGTYRVRGTTGGGGSIDISFKVGAGSTGTVDFGSPVKLVSAEGRVYVTGDETFLSERVGEDADRIAGKWLLLAPDSTSGFAMFVDGTRFAETLFGTQGPATMTPVVEVDGQPAVGLVFAETGGTLWVATAGDPRPLRFEEKGATGETGVLRFGDYGAELDVAAPAEDTVLDDAVLDDAVLDDAVLDDTA